MSAAELCEEVRVMERGASREELAACLLALVDRMEGVSTRHTDDALDKAADLGIRLAEWRRAL